MSIIRDETIVISWNESCDGGLYEVSIITEDVATSSEPLSSLIIRSQIIRDKHMGYRTLYDAKELPRIENKPTYKEFYDAVAGIYRSIIYDKILSILDGARLGMSQCDIYTQCELNNFVSQYTSNGVKWDQENLGLLMTEFGSYRSCDFTFKKPHYNILDIIQYDNLIRCCTLEATIIRNDIGMAKPYSSF